LLALHPTSELEAYPFSAFREYLFSIFAATPPYLEAVSSIRNPRPRQVTGDYTKVAKREGSSPLLPKPATGHHPKPVPFTFHPQNIFLLETF